MSNPILSGTCIGTNPVPNMARNTTVACAVMLYRIRMALLWDRELLGFSYEKTTTENMTISANPRDYIEVLRELQQKAPRVEAEASRVFDALQLCYLQNEAHLSSLKGICRAANSPKTRSVCDNLLTLIRGVSEHSARLLEAMTMLTERSCLIKWDAEDYCPTWQEIEATEAKIKMCQRVFDYKHFPAPDESYTDSFIEDVLNDNV